MTDGVIKSGVARTIRSVVGVGTTACVLGVWPHDLAPVMSGTGLGTTAIAQTSMPQTAITGFADVVDRVKPAVVGVRAKIEQGATGESGPEDSPSDRLFRDSDKPDLKPDATPRPRVMTSQGSGFFISADGYVVTTNHVIEGATAIQVATDENKTYTAKVVGADEETDLALLKIETDSQTPYVQIARKAPRIGEWVLAVGNPFGLGGTVTAGIVSARARDLETGMYTDFIQIDAPVNQGNSGGPDFDVNGGVVGFDSAIFSPTGGSVGIGFAIPAETINSTIPQLKNKGAVTRGWIGVQIQSLTMELAEGFGLSQTQGALVVEPEPASPALQAGVAAGDIITSVDDEPVKDSHDLRTKLGEREPGTSVQLTVLRHGDPQAVVVTLGEAPRKASATEGSVKGNKRPPAADASDLGLVLAPGGRGNQGVTVTDVDPNGRAAERGIEVGDIILDVGGKAVKEPADIQQALSEARGRAQRAVIARVNTSKATRFVAIPTD